MQKPQNSNSTLVGYSQKICRDTSVARLSPGNRDMKQFIYKNGQGLLRILKGTLKKLNIFFSK